MPTSSALRITLPDPAPHQAPAKQYAYWAVLRRFRDRGDGGPPGWHAVYDTDNHQPLAFVRSAQEAKQLADDWNAKRS